MMDMDGGYELDGSANCSSVYYGASFQQREGCNVEWDRQLSTLNQLNLGSTNYT